MQEATASGDFGQRVNVCRPLNAQVVASRSGKMTKEILHNWVKFVYVEAVQHNPHSLLIVDSWSAFKDFAGMDPCIHNGHGFFSRLIPECTTSEIQTLDVYEFRIIKAFIRKIEDWVIMDLLDLRIHQRNNVIKLISLVHRQFASPRFRDMWRFAWHKAGYLDQRPPEFLNPLHYCVGDRIHSFLNSKAERLRKCGWFRRTDLGLFYCVLSQRLQRLVKISDHANFA